MKQLFYMAAFLLLPAFIVDQGFLINQKKNQRVKNAYTEKKSILTERLKKLNLSLDNVQLLFVAYKSEKKLDIYAKSKTATSYQLLSTYDVCASSGVLGPKRMQGDGQVPEGFYQIDRFNPASSYYLSLGINYPNQSDKKKSKASNLGGDIFIHGECVTIGCLPMTNDKIKEIYLLAIQAYQGGQQKIPVYIFPFKMTDENFSAYKSNYASDPALILFWENLKKGYDQFTRELKELEVTINKAGDYQF